MILEREMDSSIQRIMNNDCAQIKCQLNSMLYLPQLCGIRNIENIYKQRSK